MGFGYFKLKQIHFQFAAGLLDLLLEALTLSRTRPTGTPFILQIINSHEIETMRTSKFAN